jgi:cyclophilin family peptidyl-prolyl cis-trans isomerase
MKIHLSAALLLAAILAAHGGQAVITSGPNDLTINAGSTADFTVAATGAKTYQWMFQGTNIPGATKSQYVIEAAATSQAGVYSVMVGGSTGTNLTNSATLTVLQGTIVNFQITNFPGGFASNVLVELFDHDKPATVQNFVHYVWSGAYRNMFFDRLEPGFILQGGNYDAGDQTDSTNTPFIPTNGVSGLGGIYDSYVEPGMDEIQNPTLPSQVDNEFYVGPKVSNTRGTLAMALPAGDPDGANCSFFFNLVDNTNLDTTNTGSGPFTVFGRVLSATNLFLSGTNFYNGGTNVLQYFNNTKEFSEPKSVPYHKVLTTNLGVVTTNIVYVNVFTNGIFDDVIDVPDPPAFTELPVNFHGTQQPSDASLFFLNFSFPETNAQPLIDTNPPTAAITFPPPNLILTNGIPFTLRGTAQAGMGSTALALDGTVVTVPETAQANAGLALIYCTLVGLEDQFGPATAFATGATNWSVPVGPLAPGTYNILVSAQDGAGNEGPQDGTDDGIDFVKQQMTISAVFINGAGAVGAFNISPGFVSNNMINPGVVTYISDAVGAYLEDGTEYELVALPDPGQLFLNWTSGTNLITFTPDLCVLMSSNLAVTANFISNAIPGGISFTYPPLQGTTTDGNFSIQGAINGLSNLPVALQCRLFSSSNLAPVGKVLRTTATTTTNWSFPIANLPSGHYVVQVVATNSAGQSTLINNDFTVGIPQGNQPPTTPVAAWPGLLLTVYTNGNGKGTIKGDFGGQVLVPGGQYSLKAEPSSGSVFDSWSVGTNNNDFSDSPQITFTMTPGLVLMATFLSNDFPRTVSSPILITSPAAGAKLTTQTITLAGTLNSALSNPVVTYQLFSGSNSVTPPGTNVTFTATNRFGIVWSANLSTNLTNLPPGRYTVVAAVSDALGRSTLVSQSFQILAQLTLQIEPPGFGALSSNWTAQYVPVGTSCTVTARTNGGYVFAGWSNSPGSNDSNPLTFTATTNLTITANFATNYFFNAAGSYYGLFYPTNQNSVITSSNSGYYSLILTSNGGVSIKVGFPGFTNSASWAFPLYNPTGIASQGFVWNDQHGNFVTNFVNLDLTNGPCSLTGSVLTPGSSSPLTAYRAAAKLTANSVVIPGTNVFWLPGDHSGTNHYPGGDSYAKFTLASNGVISLNGYLGDNTSFSEGTRLSTNYLNTNGVWPFYAAPYGAKGIILGWMTNTSPTNFEGTVLWSKPPKTGAYETNGISVSTNAFSATCIPPTNGTRCQIVFGGATLANQLTQLTNTLTVTNGVLTVDANQTTNLNLKLTFTSPGAKTGPLSGSFSYPSSKSSHKFYGAFINPAQGGSGYFLDTNSQTGWFEITEIP